MRAGKVAKLSVVAWCVLMLNACGTLEEKAWEPGETSLQVLDDGTVTETIIDRLDQGYYNSSELENMINSTVNEYNQIHGADAVKIEEWTIENNQVTLTMIYRSGKDYGDYNNVRFYSGSMLGAEMDGYLFYNQSQKVEKGEVTESNLSNEEALKHKEYQVLVTDASHVVRVPGDVVYISANASPMGEKEVKPAEETIKVEQEGLVLPSSAVYVEEDHSPVTAKDLEKNYIYVIYDYE